MPFFSEAERSSLAIRQMIFHIVGPLDEPILLDLLLPTPDLHEFFLERIQSGTSGNRYAFRAASTTEGQLRQIHLDSGTFLSVSKALAIDFHKHHRKTASAGAFMLFELTSSGGRPLFALLKYDDDQAIEYDYKVSNGKNEAKIRFLERTFVRKPEALQKLALVRLGENTDDSELAVRDRSHHDGISEYFEKFLDVRRVQEEAGMTQKLQLALQETFLKFQHSLPPDIRRSGHQRIAAALERSTSFDPEAPGVILGTILGGSDVDPTIEKHFLRRLAFHDIDEERFKINKAFVKKPRGRKIETVEGVRVIYDKSVENLVHINRKSASGGVEIIIKTQGIEVEDYDTENSRGRAR